MLLGGGDVASDMSIRRIGLDRKGLSRFRQEHHGPWRRIPASRRWLRDVIRPVARARWSDFRSSRGSIVEPNPAVRRLLIDSSPRPTEQQHDGGDRAGDDEDLVPFALVRKHARLRRAQPSWSWTIGARPPGPRLTSTLTASVSGPSRNDAATASTGTSKVTRPLSWSPAANTPSARSAVYGR